MSKLGLGKGLSSLLGSDQGSLFGEEKKDVEMVKLSHIEPNANQPRKDFDEKSMSELSESIKENGVLSPILVRKTSGNRYQIIAGERRYRASKNADLLEIPVRIIIADDKKASEIALIENLQREDLNPLEEARGYKELIDKYELTQEQVSKSISKSRSTIANTMRILNLPEEILKMIREGKISQGHARAILSVLDQERHVDFAKYIHKNSLNVRQSENYSKKLNQDQIQNEGLSDEYSVYFDEIQNKIEESLCRKVKIVYNKNKIDGKGKIELEYFNNEDLENLINVLSAIKM